MAINPSMDPNARTATSRKPKKQSLAPSMDAVNEGRRGNTENSIRLSKHRAVQASSVSAATTMSNRKLLNGRELSADAKPKSDPQRKLSSSAIAKVPSDTDVIPEAIRRQFVQVGRKYYFPDGARAFTDRGARLSTASENTEVIRSLITIAQARGWNDITVSGTERFRKEAWFAARLAGLEVKGYTPTDVEQGRLVRTAARAATKGIGDAEQLRSTKTMRARSDHERLGERNPIGIARARQSDLITGRLIEHGPAPYRHELRAPMTYFAILETPRGERTVWGVDLERAFKQSLTKPEIGDDIGLRAVKQDAVTVKTQQRDADGRVTGMKNLATHRNRWIVEKQSFFEARAAAAHVVRDPTVEVRDAVKEHPELAGTYLYLRGAEEVAHRRIRDLEDQHRFVSTVRSALADAVARGEPLPPVRLREQRTAPRPASKTTRSAERDEFLARG
jgi:hypothetical protein